MKIGGIEYKRVDAYDGMVTIADSFVKNLNKTCGGHGEAKLYMGPKGELRKFFTGNFECNGFTADCILLKKDLLKYMKDVKHEYFHPSVRYRGMDNGAKAMQVLWRKRYDAINLLKEDFVEFHIKEQDQIVGDRGYVKGMSNLDSDGYNIIREIALPFVSNLSIMKIKDDSNNNKFYWLLSVDYQQMNELMYNALHYGQKGAKKLRIARKGQAHYKETLYAKYRHCPFTGIDDIHLLVGSHIKPWYLCKGKEKTDPSNGFLLSPLYDTLFDKGYITFENDGSLDISEWLSDENKERISFDYKPEELQISGNAALQGYLKFHRENIFK